ncbi:MAG: metal-dependent transcriptional regulator [Anaerolineae bacterium]
MPEHISAIASAGVDEYLEAIFKLSEGEAPVSVPALAEHLAVAPASANEMVRKLVERRLAVYEPYHGVSLTEEGRLQALSVVRRHRLWERFLADVLHIPWDRIHEDACRLEHATSPLVEERLALFLDAPDSCPHGHAMPSADGHLAPEAALTIADLQPGQEATVIRVPEDNPALLRYLDTLELRPGRMLGVMAIEPFNGPVTIQAGGTNRPIARELAGRIYVRLLEGQGE